MDLSTQLHHYALTCPTHPAVVGSEDSLDYAGLYIRASTLAVQLRSTPSLNNRVGIFSTDPVTLAVAFYACVISGFSAVILSPETPNKILAENSQRLELLSAITDTARNKRVKQLGLNAIQESAAIRPSKIEAPPKISSEAELLVIFTSGSSGVPKAVVRTRASWEASISSTAKILGASTSSVSLIPGPLTHGLGLYAMVESISTGGTSIASGRWSLSLIQKLLRITVPNRIVAVPSLVDRLLTGLSQEVWSQLTHVIMGGENLPSSLARRVQELNESVSCIEYFGSSEHSFIAYRDYSQSNMQLKPLELAFVGRLFDGIVAHLHGQESDESPGRLMVQSPFNSAGYHPSGPGTVERCQDSIGNGDIARLMPDRIIQVFGRSGDMINLNGNNIYPDEISRALEDIEIPNAKVIVRLDVDGYHLLTAYVLTDNPGALAAGPEIYGALEEFLPRYKIPHELVFLDAWPLNGAGKLDKSRLPTPSAHNTLRLR